MSIDEWIDAVLSVPPCIQDGYRCCRCRGIYELEMKSNLGTGIVAHEGVLFTYHRR